MHHNIQISANFEGSVFWFCRGKPNFNNYFGVAKQLKQFITERSRQETSSVSCLSKSSEEAGIFTFIFILVCCSATDKEFRQAISKNKDVLSSSDKAYLAVLFSAVTFQKFACSKKFREHCISFIMCASSSPLPFNSSLVSKFKQKDSRLRI